MDSLVVDLKTTTQTASNIFQILFFIAVGTVSVLSYLQARKTLFTPIKTETFKIQLDDLQEILLFFQQKSGFELLSMFDIERTFKLNAFVMLDNYIESFFSDEIEINEDAKEERYKDFVGGVFTEEYAQKNLEKVDYETKVGENHTPPKKPTNPAIIATNWQNYEHGMIQFTKQYEDKMTELRQLAASPLIPEELRDLINKFRQKVGENLMAIGETLTEIAGELPEKYPNAEDLENVHVIWMLNEYNKNKVDLEEPAQEILDFINNYLSIEDLKEMS